MTTRADTARLRRVAVLIMCAVLAATGGGAAVPVAAQPGGDRAGAASGPPPRPADLDPKLDSGLDALARVAASESPSAATEVAGRRGFDIVGSRVRLEIVATRNDRAGVASAVAAAGGVVEAEYADLVQALVPAGSLRALAADSSIRFLRESSRPHPNAVLGEEVASTHANVWQANGYTGAGVKIAVIDSGFTNYQAAQAAGELPAGSQLVAQDFCGGNITAAGGEHGLATAQIVHETAPGAKLYLLCVNSIVTLGQAVDYAISQGVHVISESASWYNLERGDGTGGAGTPHGIATAARNAGVLWVASAGNRQQTHWRGSWSDPDGDDFLSFSGADETLATSIGAFSTGCVYLKWDNWPTTTEDYDLYLWRASDNTLLVASLTYQAGLAQAPVERVCYTNGGANPLNVYLQIVKVSATGNATFDLFGHGMGTFEYRTSSSSVTEPATSPNVLAVGAICWKNDALNSHSSLGPTIDGRIKPDMAGPDSISGPVFGSFNGACGAAGFTGTSASAPAAAGAAALLKQANMGYTPAQLQSALETRARDLGAAGKDNTYGAGKLWLGPTPYCSAAGTYGYYGTAYGYYASSYAYYAYASSPTTDSYYAYAYLSAAYNYASAGYSAHAAASYSAAATYFYYAYVYTYYGYSYAYNAYAATGNAYAYYAYLYGSSALTYDYNAYSYAAGSC